MSEKQSKIRELAVQVSTIKLHAELQGTSHGIYIDFDLNVDTNVLDVVDKIKHTILKHINYYDYDYVNKWLIALEEFKESVTFKHEGRFIALCELLKPYTGIWCPGIFASFPGVKFTAENGHFNYRELYELNQNMFKACIGKTPIANKYIMYERCKAYLDEHSLINYSHVGELIIKQNKIKY